ncbi:MAG: hypothetical protein GYA63_07830 [Armatimonadetes bacterium]|jgi:hypothetical protein|nr:hypothetical protein [Armatimonadota bacterium]
MGNIDRRILYLIALLVMTLPLFLKLPLPIADNKRSLDAFDAIEKVDQSKGNQVILLSVNFSPDTKGESLPQARAMVVHMLQRSKKFIIYTMSSTGVAGQQMVDDEAKAIAAELTKQGKPRAYGKDWANMGYKPASSPILEGMARNVPGFFTKDSRGTPVDQLPVMDNIKTADDIGMVIDVSPTASYELWIQALTSKFDIPLLLAPTSVMVPDTYPYLISGQAQGELRGVLGAAEYESLLVKNKMADQSSVGTRVMTSMAALNAYIMILIILGNVTYFRSLRKGEVTK